MAILVTGGTGFIGSHLLPKLQKIDSEIYVLTRKPKKAQKKLGDSYLYISSLNDINPNTNIQGIINLAGAPIDRRWRKSYKKKLLKSRLSTTQACVELIKRLDHKPKWFISGSAIGYYGAQKDNTLTEKSLAQVDFTHELCHQWEACALEATQYGTRVCLPRIGVVLGKNGGALSKMLPFFKMGLGGKVATGKQWFSWVHMDDLINILLELIKNDALKGPMNATSPSPVTNLEFTKTLGKVLKRPTFFNVPKFMVKLLYGEMGIELLSKGQRVFPEKLTQQNFKFQHPKLEEALSNLLIKHK